MGELGTINAPTSGRDKRQELFLQLLADSYADIEAYIRTLIFDRVDAEDVLQDVCVRLWKNFDEFEFGRSFRRWAFGVTYNVARQYWRNRKRSTGQALSEEALAKLSKVHQATVEIAEMRQDMLRECIERLPEADKSLVRKVYYRSNTVAEVARETGKRANSISMKLNRIRNKLSDCIERKMT
ncbi:sigma-70 family RNA polymerase sigma factor [Calycomorphotria hydatis]|uniref:RNA polymerase sigma factor n=1 Tax=Calycomorphotria hydatis TaxID=2528027 RepID=A0A517T5R3_9PLAN|nr:sigma-70 family RNA polymerase sigma factor [Calycomorphotria hydatis]QDT63726.1 RNA polymerase sigma factor [Calycomorphotria hydatis]